MRRRKGSQYLALHLTDTDIADNIALISQSLAFEQASNCRGLYLNETKTEYINKCFSNNDIGIRTLRKTPQTG